MVTIEIEPQVMFTLWVCTSGLEVAYIPHVKIQWLHESTVIYWFVLYSFNVQI